MHAQNVIFDSILDTTSPQPNDKQDGEWFACHIAFDMFMSIHANSPGNAADLPLVRMGDHISQIKSSFELFCALVSDLAYF